MQKQVLINVESTDLRVAVIEDGTLAELFVEDFNTESILSNIYKGRVEGIVPGLKAVFVNIGLERNAFLHFSDILPEYVLPNRGRPERYTAGGGRAASRANAGDEPGDEDDYIPPPIVRDDEEEGEGGKPKAAKRRSRTLRVGDPILVQVTKEPISTKGPRVTTFISLPGRYVVSMPFALNRGGVSRKIENPDERRRLRDLMRRIEPETGSFIIRTAGLDASDEEIIEDHAALEKIWKSVKRKNLRAKAPSLIHNEQNILHRLVRDTLRNDIDEILIDSRPELKKLIKSCEAMAPSMVARAHLYESRRNIFDVFEVEQQFQKALRRKVWLKSGGFLILDETEALTAIDVNSGKYVGSDDQDQVILKTNLEACGVAARQLRLRDLGGLIIIDFIDMTNRDHQQQVLRELRGCMRRDNAKYAMTGISEFGLVEMTRKRVRRSLANAVSKVCPYCEGTGRIHGDAQVWKNIKYALLEELSKESPADSVQVTVNSDIRTYLEKEVVAELGAMAHQYKIRLNFVGKPDFHHERFEIVRQVDSIDETEKPKPARKRRPASKKVVASSRDAT